jgi:hypothetical protein
MFEDFSYIPRILTSPSEFFDEIGPQSLGTLFKFFAVMSIILFAEMLVFSLLVSFIGLSLFGGFLGGSTSFLAGSILGILFGTVAGYIFFVTFGFLFAMIFAGIVHAVAYLMGCRGYMNTLTALVVGVTPSLVLGGIPLINILAGLYSLILEIVGMSKLHSISMEKAAAAVLIPMVTIYGLMFLFVFSWLGPLFATGTMMGGGTTGGTSGSVPVFPGMTPDGTGEGITETTAGVSTIPVSQVPEKFPSDIPIHSSLQYTGFNELGAEGSTMITLHFVSTETTENILDFYESEMAKIGWTKGFKMVEASGGYISFGKDDENKIFTVGVSSDDGQTTVVLSYSFKEQTQ